MGQLSHCPVPSKYKCWGLHHAHCYQLAFGYQGAHHFFQELTGVLEMFIPESSNGIQSSHRLWFCFLVVFFNFLFYIGVQLINKVVLVSSTQQSDNSGHHAGLDRTEQDIQLGPQPMCCAQLNGHTQSAYMGLASRVDPL